jgi:hypothetical protein
MQREEEERTEVGPRRLVEREKISWNPAEMEET